MHRPSTASGLAGPDDERRADGRLTAYGLPLVSPDDTLLVDCSQQGAGLESDERLSVGSLTKVGLVLPQGELALIGRVCWSRRIRGEALAHPGARTVYRAGVAFVAGQSLGTWRGLVSALGSPPLAGGRHQKGRRVVKWRRRRSQPGRPGERQPGDQEPE